MPPIGFASPQAGLGERPGTFAEANGVKDAANVDNGEIREEVVEKLFRFLAERYDASQMGPAKALMYSAMMREEPFFTIGHLRPAEVELAEQRFEVGLEAALAFEEEEKQQLEELRQQAENAALPDSDDELGEESTRASAGAEPARPCSRAQAICEAQLLVGKWKSTFGVYEIKIGEQPDSVTYQETVTDGNKLISALSRGDTWWQGEVYYEDDDQDSIGRFRCRLDNGKLRHQIDQGEGDWSSNEVCAERVGHSPPKSEPVPNGHMGKANAGDAASKGEPSPLDLLSDGRNIGRRGARDAVGKVDESPVPKEHPKSLPAPKVPGKYPPKGSGNSSGGTGNDPLAMLSDSRNLRSATPRGQQPAKAEPAKAAPQLQQPTQSAQPDAPSAVPEGDALSLLADSRKLRGANKTAPLKDSGVAAPKASPFAAPKGPPALPSDVSSSIASASKQSAAADTRDDTWWKESGSSRNQDGHDWWKESGSSRNQDGHDWDRIHSSNSDMGSRPRSQLGSAARGMLAKACQASADAVPAKDQASQAARAPGKVEEKAPPPRTPDAVQESAVRTEVVEKLCEFMVLKATQAKEKSQDGLVPPGTIDKVKGLLQHCANSGQPFGVHGKVSTAEVSAAIAKFESPPPPPPKAAVPEAFKPPSRTESHDVNGGLSAPPPLPPGFNQREKGDTETAKGSPEQAGAFCQGQRIEAMRREGDWAPGKIQSINKDGTYFILWDDGFTAIKQPPSKIRGLQATAPSQATQPKAKVEPKASPASQLAKESGAQLGQDAQNQIPKCLEYLQMMELKNNLEKAKTLLRHAAKNGIEFGAVGKLTEAAVAEAIKRHEGVPNNSTISNVPRFQ